MTIERKWFVAYVRSCQERVVAQTLANIGIEHYLPMQREVHRWSDRNKIVVRLLLPRMIFVKVDELARKRLLKVVYGMTSYMMDRSANRPAVVREADMQAFRMMVEHIDEPVRMSSEPLMKGDRVRVLDGPLEGMEYELVQVHGRKCIAIRLDMLGSAFVEFSESNLEKI